MKSSYKNKDAFDLTVSQALNNPEIRDVFKKNLPGLLKHPLIGFAKNHKLKDLAVHAGKMNIKKEKIEIVRSEINKILNKN